MKILKLILFSLLSLLQSCEYSEKQDNNSIYVRNAFEILRENIINENQINLDSLELEVLKNISDTSSMDSLHKQLRQSVRLINKHSDLMPLDEINKLAYNPDPPTIRGSMINDRIGYVYVSSCEAIDSIHSKLYADSLQTILLDLYAQKPKGWIIDLRDNSGGNMYPMIAGLGPLFGEGNLGFDIGKEIEPWYFKKADVEGKVQVLEIAMTSEEFDEKLPLVGLINENTGSAAEAVAISLKCYPNSILIGKHTYGVSTGNRMFFLPDSACLNITNSIMADCNKNKYPDGIHPDVEIENAYQLFEYAEKWIDENQ